MDATGNGVMYTSEFFIILNNNGQEEPHDRCAMLETLRPCINQDHTLNRYRDGSRGDQEQVDDYYALLHALSVYKLPSIARGFLLALIKGKGCLNNVDGKWNTDSFLARQPQLVACMVAVGFPTSSLLDRVVRFLAFPLFAYSALLWLFSCRNVSTSDTDSRRLAWHCANTLTPVSLLNRLTYKVWLKRLYKDYPRGMNDVAALYYSPQGDNPFAKYWVT